MAIGSQLVYQRSKSELEEETDKDGKKKKKGKKYSIEELKTLGKEGYEKYLSGNS